MQHQTETWVWDVCTSFERVDEEHGAALGLKRGGPFEGSLKRLGRRGEVARVDVRGRDAALVGDALELAQQGRLPDPARAVEEEDVERQRAGVERFGEEGALGRSADKPFVAAAKAAVTIVTALSLLAITMT